MLYKYQIIVCMSIGICNTNYYYIYINQWGMDWHIHYTYGV
jgi:hypothetical protein